MSKCKCYEIEERINKENPNCDWNLDEACEDWYASMKDLEDKNIKFERCSDEIYSCTCPTCGRIVCSWCL